MKRPLSSQGTSGGSTEHEPISVSSDEGDGVLPRHSPYCSAFAGALRSGGNAVLGSEGIEVMKHTLESSLKKGTAPLKTTRTTSTPTKAILSASASSIAAKVARVAIPGGLAFETHHATAKYLLDLRKRINATDSSTTTIPLGSLASHTLHFVAGGAGGLSFGLAATLLQPGGWQVPTGTFLLRHVLSHGALFGGFDCFMDIVPSLVKRMYPSSEENDNAKIREFASVGLSGGCAGVVQQLVGRHLLSSGKSFSLRSTALAFPPGALAFLAYHYTAEVLGGGGGGGHH